MPVIGDRPRTSGPRRAQRRTRRTLCAFAAALAATVAAAAAPGDAGAATADRGPRDDTRPRFYASLHPRTAPPSADVLPLSFDYDGPPRTARLTVDVRGIDGVASIPSAADGCAPRKPVFTCTMRLNPASEGWSRQELVVKPAPGARPGDSGVLRYSLATQGLPTVEGSLTVIAGRPELRVNKGARARMKAVGETFEVPVLIRNTGDVPARGVEVSLDGGGDLAAAARHSNCRYANAGTAVLCRLPDAEIGPGETFRVTPAQRLEPAEDALDARLSYVAWPAGEQPYRDLPPGEHERGTAAPITLTRDQDGGAGVAFTTSQDPADLAVPVRNTADYEAVGTTLRGDVGSEHRVRIGFRNNGPADPNAAKGRAVFTVPPGAVVVKAPYDPELAEEMFPQVCVTKDHGRTYTCSRHSAVGEDAFFEFTLRVVRKDPRPGSVAVSAALPDRPGKTARVEDPHSGNDRAPVRLEVPGAAGAPAGRAEGAAEGSGPGALVWSAGAAAVAVAGAGLLLARRRRGSRAGEA